MINLAGILGDADADQEGLLGVGASVEYGEGVPFLSFGTKV